MYPTERDMCISAIGGIPVAIEGVPFTYKEEWAYCVLSIFLAVTRSVSGANRSEGGRGDRVQEATVWKGMCACTCDHSNTGLVVCNPNT